MNDPDLRELAQRAGAPASRRLNTDRVVERVLGRLRDEGAREAVVRPPSFRTRWLRIAAAIVLMVTGGVVARHVLTTDATQARFAVPLAWEELDADEWGEVLDSLTYHAPVHDYIATTTLYDLTEEQLRELLSQMES